MNLNKRASTLILPVIFVSYALTALVIYEQQSRSIQQLEQNKLDLRLSTLLSEFSFYDHFLDAYLVSLLEGETLEKYIREPNNIYRDSILSANLKSAVKRYFNSSEKFTSLSIIDSRQQNLFYVENSTDPFSTIQDEQLKMASAMQSSNQINKWEHHLQPSGSLIQHGISIDSRTLTTPHATQLDNTLQVIVAISPSSFDQLLQETQTEYNAEISFLLDQKRNNQNNGKLFSSVQLKDNYSLLITPSLSYLNALLLELQLRCIFIVAIGTILTFSLLQMLIRQFITSPISLLDKQLTEVIERSRQNIDAPTSNDEIGRLGRKFHNLYQQLHQAYRESHIQSRTDALTQLPNRAAFYDTATRTIKTADKAHSPISLIYIDLDNFKFVNDKYGHEMGDQLLKTVAIKLNHIISISIKNQANALPSAYRLSGDEFIVLLPDINSSQAQVFCDKILNLFSDGYHFELGNFPVTASIGIATYPQDGHTLSQLISNADLAMYQAKRSGKNKQAIYSKDLAKKDRQAKDIESKLKSPSFKDELTLNYMPIVDKSGEIKGCEALLRWNSKTLGAVSPALFIPIAENTGMFELIDLWVAEQAFKDFSRLKETFGESFELSINISSAEIGSEHFINRLEKLSSEHSIQPNSIILEITETFSFDKEHSALEWLSELRLLGFKIAIDDFGTGYTNLMQMIEYPIDTIKFDKQLIDRLTQPEKHTLAKALINLCHIQGINVVAEGIESAADYKILLDSGCDFQQGFYIAKPMPFNKIQLWFESYQTNSFNIHNNS